MQPLRAKRLWSQNVTEPRLHLDADAWSLSQLIAALDHMLTETEAENWTGQVRWLSQWRR